MKLLDLTLFSLKGIKNRGSRFWFTVLGMAVAIGVILFLVSLGFGLQNLLLQQIATEESLLVLDVSSSDPDVIKLTPDLLPELEAIEGVERVLPQLVATSEIDLGELSSQSTINGVDPGFFLLAGLVPSHGRFFNTEEKQAMVVNEGTAELFHIHPEEILGKQLTLTLFLTTNGEELEPIELEGDFLVTGLVSQPGAPSQIYLPRDVIEASGSTSQAYQMVKVKAKDEGALASIREEVISKGFMVSALSEIIEEADRVFRVLQIILGIFGVFALIVAAIGLINTMTITLLERTNEIGIMRATGASPRNIKWLFLTESVLTGFIGGVLGIFLGFLFAEGFNVLLNILARTLGGQSVSLFTYPVWFLLFILFLSSAVGFVAGLWPARRAAKLNPLLALRYK